jgi:hypothetical protein
MKGGIMHGWAINIEELVSTNTNCREVLYTRTGAHGLGA